MTISRCVLLRMGNALDKSCRENQNHIWCSVTFYENRAVDETMSKNVEETGGPQMTIWRMRGAPFAGTRCFRLQRRTGTWKVRRYDHPQCIYQTTWCHNYKNITIRTYAALKSPNLFFDACVNPQKPLYTYLFRVSALLRSHRSHSAIVPIPVHVCTNTYRWGQALVLRGTDPCCFPCLLPCLVLADVTLTLLLRVRYLLRCC